MKRFTKFAFISISISSSIGLASVDKLEDKTWTISPNISIPTYDISFNSKFHSKNLEIKPNTQSLLGLTIGHKNIGSIAAALRLPMSDDDFRKKGHTHYQDFRIHIPYQQVLFRIDYQRYVGVYIHNTSDFGGAPSGESIILPDFVGRNIGLNAFYVVKPKQFSIHAALLNNEIQKESGGSLLHGFHYTETVFDNHGVSFIPENYQSEFGTDGSINYAKFRAILLSIGYGYTFVFKKGFYLTAAGWAGIGGSIQHYSTDNQRVSNTRPGYRADILLAGGYNYKDFFSSLTIMANGNNYTTNEGEFSSILNNVALNIGFRF